MPDDPGKFGDGRRLRLTAAIPSERVICLTTLSHVGGRLHLVPTLTAFFEIENFDQASVQQLARQLFAYFSAHQIGEVIARRGPSRGSHAISGRTETILQLLPITCTHVYSSKVTAWAKGGASLLPAPQASLTARNQDIQRRAIEGAAFGIDRLLADPAHKTRRH